MTAGIVFHNDAICCMTKVHHHPVIQVLKSLLYAKLLKTFKISSI